MAVTRVTAVTGGRGRPAMTARSGGKRVEAMAAERRRSERRAAKQAKRQARRAAKRDTGQEGTGHAEPAR